MVPMVAGAFADAAACLGIKAGSMFIAVEMTLGATATPPSVEATVIGKGLSVALTVSVQAPVIGSTDTVCAGCPSPKVIVFDVVIFWLNGLIELTPVIK